LQKVKPFKRMIQGSWEYIYFPFVTFYEETVGRGSDVRPINTSTLHPLAHPTVIESGYGSIFSHN